MNYRFRITLAALLTIVAPILAGPAGAARNLTLDEAYRLTLKHSEAIAIGQESVAEAMARVDELQSVVLPQLGIRATEVLQDPAADNLGGGLSGSFVASSRPQVNLTLHQNLFTGFREFMALDAAKAQGEGLALRKTRAEHLLYLDVANAYLDLLATQRQIQIRQTIVNVTTDRVAELNDRVRLGRSRSSESLAAQAQLAQVQADLEGMKKQESLAQEVLQFLAGVSDNIAPRDLDLPAAPTLKEAVEKSAGRPDVIARRKDVEAARLAADIAGRGMWPVIAADGNYYLERHGFQAPIKWDATISASIPLYSGGAVGAQAKQAEARLRAARQALSLAERQAALEVRSAYEDVTSGVRVTKALEQASNLSEANVKAQTQDYRLGLVNNLDVLGAFNSLEATKLQWDNARIQTLRAAVRLQVAQGGLVPQ